MHRARFVWILLLTVALAWAHAPAGTAKEPEREASVAKDEKETPLSVTEREITIAGKAIKYRATAGYLVLKREKGDPARTSSSSPTPSPARTTPRGVRSLFHSTGDRARRRSGCTSARSARNAS